ncbi:fimbrial protein [Burkholderia sp. Ac-20365]|uniref:fimbrial protein n=1 Tax=Burkholderia sp. Ac-20365 TaxID=2703897 RepID=UPI00197B74FC|nr:fimbrial protein [Burkholderia sp. Ac-20365]MBN3764313.1 fimbrial protein [Burkholderia sp. Ac-20365]
MNKVLDAGTISIPVNAAPGTTITTHAPESFQFNCHYDPKYQPKFATDNTLYADFSTNAARAPGFNNVYATDVPGLGVRYTFNSSQCNAHGAVLTNNSLRLSCPMRGFFNEPLYAYLSVTWSLVVTGPIASGATTLSKAPTVSLGFTTSANNGYWNQPPLYTGSASGSLALATCSVDQPNVSVDLPTIEARALAQGVGAVAGPVPFSLSLTCVGGGTAFITITDGVDPANRGTTLGASKDSTARGVGVQLLDPAGKLIAYGPDSNAPGNPGQWKVGAAPQGTLKIPLTARYVRTADVSAGSVRALATFTMSFQ